MSKMILQEQAAPDTPATDKVALYPKAGGGVYKKSDDGVDMPLVEGNGALTTILVGGGANTKPVWTEATGSDAPVRATSPTLVTPTIISTTSVADDAEITLDTAKTGWGTAMAGVNEEIIKFRFTAAGVVAVIYNSANAINTDTDGCLCVYDAGTGIAIKNRLGATKNIRHFINYS